MKAKEFLESILGEAAGYATVVTKDSNGQPTVQKFFSYPDEFSEMVEYAESMSAGDVYFSPILFAEKRRIREHATSVSSVYADSDLATQTTLGCHQASTCRPQKVAGTHTGCLRAPVTQQEWLT